MKYKNLIFSVGMAAALGCALSCEKKAEMMEDVFESPDTQGLRYAVSDLDHSTVYNNVVADLESKAAIGIVAEVDHKSNASNVDVELRNTKLVLFGNPALGTPVMQKNQLAGLDLPQKILVYDDVDGNTVAAYNDIQYLEKRHDLGDVATLETMKMALAGIAGNAADGDVEGNDANVSFQEGITIKESSNSFESTYNGIIDALNGVEKIKIIAELDHQANAATVGMELRPTSLIVFGNPALGSPLMASSQTTAIDLPQKILVYEAEDGKVMVAYNNPEYVAARHDIEGNEVTIGQISGALDALTNAGTE